MVDIGSLLGTARGLARAAVTLDVEPDHPLAPLFDELVTHPQLAKASRQLFVDHHYARAVEEGFKALCARVRERTGLTVDGRSLMETAFSEKKPKLRLNDLTDRSQRDEQIGHKDMFAGSITGLRNPRAHDHLYTDSPEQALRLLALADYLFTVVESAATDPI